MALYRMIRSLRGRPAADAIALTAVMIAATTVATLVLRVPIPATGGYFNFCDVLVYFTALSFGPWIGLIAGGVGPAIADLLGPYAAYAPITLFAHGLQGFVAALLGRRMGVVGVVLGWLAGSLVMIGLYYLGGTAFLRVGVVSVEGVDRAAVTLLHSPALGEVPANVLQNAIGGLIGIPLYYAVRKAYPPILRLGRPRTWQEKQD
jgi:uncharacterized membrane protein